MLQTLNILASRPLASAGATEFPVINPLAAILDFVRRNFWRIVLGGLVGAVLAFLAMGLLTEQYAASARLMVDPRDLKVLDKEVSPTAAPSDATLALIESQTQVLASDNVLKKVAETQNLAADPEFNGERELSSRIGAPLRYVRKLLGAPDAERAESEYVALATLRKKIDVVRLGKSFIIEVGLSTDDREKSRRIVENVVNAYLEDQAAARAEAASNAGSSIDAGLEDLRKKVVAAERKVDEYKRQNNLVGASGRLVNEQQLTEVNNQLVLARAEAERSKARLATIRAAGRDLERIPEAVRSETLRTLRGQLNTIVTQKARFAAQLRPKHPVMQSLSEQEAAARKQINDELQRIKASAELEHERARANEAALARSVNGLQQTMNTSSAAQIRQRELEGELDASRSVYNTALLRAREAREQARLNTTNVRIISPPLAQWDRVFPPRRLLAVPVGFVIGASIAALALWILETLTALRAFHAGATAATARAAPSASIDAPAAVSKTTQGVRAGPSREAQREPDPAAVSDDDDVDELRASRAQPQRAMHEPGLTRTAVSQTIARAKQAPLATVTIRPARDMTRTRRLAAAVRPRPVPAAAATIYADLRGVLGHEEIGALREGVRAGEAPLISLTRTTRSAPHGRLSAKLSGLLDSLMTRKAAGKRTKPHLISVVADCDSLKASAVALGLASVAGRHDMRCLLVDADPVSRRLSRALAPNAAHGLRDVLAGRMSMESAIATDSETGLDIVPASRGHIGSAERTMAGFTEAVAAASGYDIVIVDCGPVQQALRDIPALSAADDIVLVVTSGVDAGPSTNGQAAHLPRLSGIVMTD